MTEREKLLETLKVAYEPRKIPQEDGSVALFYPTDEDVADMIEAAVIDECKRRAEVAEQALLLACINLIKDKEDGIDTELLARVVYTKFLRKAEKELTEEKEAQERRLKEIKGGKCK